MKKRKTNYSGDPARSHIYDRCQTPPHALGPLLPHLPPGRIWEPAAGEGQLAKALERIGFEVLVTDILGGCNFFTWQPPAWDCQVTNPPFSTKYRWLTRSYELARPFALLMPVDVIGTATAQRLFERYGVEIILLDKRIDFKMPHAGYSGKGAHFSVAWFTWGLGIGRDISYGKVFRGKHTEKGVR